MRLAFVLLLLAGCGDTGQVRVRYPALATGAPGTFSAGGWDVVLDVATVGFGPAYFCATAAASMDLCPTAVNELAAVAAFDALAAAPQPLGDVVGVAGALRSVAYDFGITWFTRQTAPSPAAGAPAGHSARFEGRASKGMTTFRFVADIDVAPSRAGTLAVQGARVEADVGAQTARLTVAVDPRRFWDDVDFDALAAEAGDPIVVAPGSRAFNSVVLRMTTTAAPTFRWDP